MTRKLQYTYTCVSELSANSVWKMPPMAALHSGQVACTQGLPHFTQNADISFNEALKQSQCAYNNVLWVYQRECGSITSRIAAISLCMLTSMSVHYKPCIIYVTFSHQGRYWIFGYLNAFNYKKTFFLMKCAFN